MCLPIFKCSERITCQNCQSYKSIVLIDQSYTADSASYWLSSNTYVRVCWHATSNPTNTSLASHLWVTESHGTSWQNKYHIISTWNIFKAFKKFYLIKGKAMTMTMSKYNSIIHNLPFLPNNYRLHTLLSWHKNVCDSFTYFHMYHFNLPIQQVN